MFSIFSKKQNSFVGLVFGIGSSTVGGALVRFEEGKLPHIFYTVREHILQDDMSPERSLAKMIEALRRADLKLAKDGTKYIKPHSWGNRHPKAVYCVLSMPWCHSRSKMLSIDATKNPFTISKTYIEELLDNEESIFEQEMEKSVDKKEKEHDYVPVGKEIIKIKVNGYDVSEPYGKVARTLDVAFFVSMIKQKILSKIEDVLSRSHHTKDIKSFAFPVAAFSVIRDMSFGTNNFVFVDVAGEYTNIYVAREGVVIENSGFPYGRNFVARKIAEAMKEPFDVAVSLVNAYFRKQIDEKVRKDIEKIIEDVKKDWSRYLEVAFSDIANRVILPKSLYLMTGDFVPLFMDVMNGLKVGSSGALGASFEAHLLTYDGLKKNVTFGESADADYFLALETAFVGKTVRNNNE